MSTEYARTSTNTGLSRWASLVRSNCIVVSGNQDGLIAAVNVSQRFEGISDGDRQALRNVARDLAAEYGLLAEVEDMGASIAVRLSRPLPEEAPGRGLSGHRGIGAGAISTIKTADQCRTAAAGFGRRG